MDVTLRVTQGKNVGQDVPIPGKKFLIGRAEDCHLRAGSDLISRHHCVIIIEDGYLSVRDFGSKNGSYVNDERIAGECELKHGDQLRVGPLEFTVQVSQGSLSGKKKPPVHDAKEAAARTAATPVEEEPDVARWLSEPATPIRDPATQDTQMVRTGDTDEIDIGSTREFGFTTPGSSSTPNSSMAPAAKGDSSTVIQTVTPAQPAPTKLAPVAAKATVAPEPKAAVATMPKPTSAVEAKAAPAVEAKVAPPAPKPAAVPKPVSLGSQPAAGPVEHVPRPTAPLKAFVADPAPEAAPAVPDASATNVPAPAAEKKGFFGGGKKFGKLPQQAKEGTKDSRSAASEMLDKLRKRR